MPDDLYLIAHLVRGEPTFAIATKDEEGEFWIEPSIGHRVYPYWFLHLSSLAEAWDHIAGFNIPEPPLDHQDFWGSTLLGSDLFVSEESKAAGTELLQRLGLGKAKAPTPPLVRRF